jgi:drug/metabolite transporter (DMT)-like permease
VRARRSIGLTIATSYAGAMTKAGEGRVVGRWRGAILAVGAAALFGASTPAAKFLLARVDPWLLAAILYLGSGAGLGAFRILQRATTPPAARQTALHGRDWAWLSAAILFGGVIGPVLLMIGLSRGSASSTSLMLNLESVATALVAWFVFRENFDRRIVLAMLAIAGGAFVLSWQGAFSLSDFVGPLAIAGACLAWAIDNNLTRKISLSDPVQIAMLKGLVAGSINLGLALSPGAALPQPGEALAGAAIGLLGYGASLVMFVLALREIGAARTGAYFATAPFIGALVAFVLLGEPLTWQLAFAGLLMAIGLWLHLTERHEHEHEHLPAVHEHRHSHDDHHAMPTAPTILPASPMPIGTPTRACATLTGIFPILTTSISIEGPARPPRAFSADVGTGSAQKMRPNL